MTHSLRCSCGSVQGTLKRPENVNRCVCYCADCQAFAHFLKRDDEILDDLGGTSILQTLPDNISFEKGTENVRCMRLTSEGLLRWYAACCNTPIGNTPPSRKTPFIGLIHNFVSLDPESLDSLSGPIRMHIHPKDAIGENKPKSVGVFMGTLRIIAMILRARLDGRYKHTPFFSPNSGAPTVTPEILSNQELKDLMDAV